jgi:putative FmdB family regulatory protein
MPTYEYVCEACSHTWDAFQSIKEEPLRQCPACHEERARRVISGGMGFILKGGGWYSDLYASAKPGSGTKAEGDSSSSQKSEPSAGAKASSEAKPAKSETKSEAKKAAPGKSSD